MKIEQFAALRRAGVPICAIETADPAASIVACQQSLSKEEAAKTPILSWDIIKALVGLNTEGEVVAAGIGEPIVTGNLAECLKLCAAKKPTDAIIFIHNAHKFVPSVDILQGVWNCRDIFKASKTTLVLLAPDWKLPAELKNDIVVLSEPLPDRDEIDSIINSTLDDAGLDGKKLATRSRTIDTLRGLSAFGAEQILAMSLSQKQIVNLPELMKLKRSYIAQLPGIEIRDDAITFDDIAGYDNVKRLLSLKIKGKRPPGIIVWLDEIEKAFAGSSTDTSGVTQDQIGTILTWMQDRLNEDRMSAAMLLGFPGTGKSAITAASRNEAKCECVRMDMGGMKDSLVGGSEQRIRQTLKTIDAMSAGHILVLGTCNSLANLPSALLSRFAFGTYFFDLPSAEEGKALWALKRKKYKIDAAEPDPGSDGWTGREIQQCCFLADDLQIPLADAARNIAPFVATGANEIESLRTQASGRFLDASRSGLYRKASASEQQTKGRKLLSRRIKLCRKQTEKLSRSA